MERFSQFSEQIQTLVKETSPKITLPLAAYGLYKIIGTYLLPPAVGLIKHSLRPRRNLLERYHSNWALVTGASDGIGEAICHELAKSGFNIVLLSRTQEKLEKVEKDLKNQYHIETRIICFDLLELFNQEGVEKLYSSFDNLDVEISIVVNSAGKAHVNPIHKHTIDMCFFMVNVNVNAMLFITRYFSAKFVDNYQRQREQFAQPNKPFRRSAIINISSISALGFGKQVSLYSATKAFDRVFSNTVAVDYESEGIDVLTVTPMNVRTGMNSGIYLGTITAQQHAKAVIDQLGWERETIGHWRHYLQGALSDFPPTNFLISRINMKRRQQFILKRDQLEKQQKEKEALEKTQ
ncbi:steroid dehydrogenase [Stylonychia lemnae]|uniref:Steroid dehydrogenase n=1 Tax=Stylonychia lemnae TaxID=5949 RepID=A0A078AF63_STYLE|nr:steroid dehydrogenase [Stylonychia lemnae]|eukprot:CDW80855.1 steroid dehydrogenase [Stylonychia lemnae]